MSNTFSPRQVSSEIRYTWCHLAADLVMFCSLCCITLLLFGRFLLFPSPPCPLKSDYWGRQHIFFFFSCASSLVILWCWLCCRIYAVAWRSLHFQEVRNIPVLSMKDWKNGARWTLQMDSAFRHPKVWESDRFFPQLQGSSWELAGAKTSLRVTAEDSGGIWEMVYLHQ